MKRFAWMLTLLLFANPLAMAHGDRDKAECTIVKERIRTIQSKMRAGYTRAQGEKYEAQLRELRVKRHKLCR